MNQAEFKKIVREQDRLVSAVGADIWIGMEPTFTRRLAETPQWLSEALGEEKLTYAYALLREVRQCQPGGIVLHTLGRQYNGEELPRWSIGYYLARNGEFSWGETVADPCVDIPGEDYGQEKDGQNETVPMHASPVESPDIEAFWLALNHSLNEAGWRSAVFKVDNELNHRILFRCDTDPLVADQSVNAKLARSSVHQQTIPINGLIDALALQGDFLLCLGLRAIKVAQHERICTVIELPAMADVKSFVQLIQCILGAAKKFGIAHLYLQGFPPPVDESVFWTTITPDPAVIEINQAPANNAENFYEICSLYYGAAQKTGLDPFRLQYNGAVSDSGGGGQFTLGGPQPASSPFFCYPQLLPRLVRYLNAHPALSYWFAPPSIGSSSQSPRCDEGVQESFNELAVALEQLEVVETPAPEFIWRSLNPFLVDPSGNPHRSELNIEKLWNPYLPGRGCLGLVEFRAFRMSRSPECATAIAILLRSIAAMLSKENKVAGLVDHGRRLHDKFALPFFLHADLQQVFADLDEAEVPLHDSIKTILLREPVRQIGEAEFHGCRIELQQALEFWPLMGDVASQEGGGSRLVDASTTRLQLTLRAQSHHPSQLDGWEVMVEGFRVPLRLEQDKHGPVKVCGLRYRNFLPSIGLHPGVGARNNIQLVLLHRGLKEAMRVTCWEWHPQGLAYPGLPSDMNDAAQRRAERFVTQACSVENYAAPKAPPETAMTDYCLDVRRLAI